MGWLSGWNYRKSVTLSRASGAVTNYQMKLLVGESSGASGEDVDCGGLCQSDFDDLRFTTSDGETLLDYWIESTSGVSPNQLATVWIEFDSIGTGATTFYMYYGNSSASGVSNGINTFIKFDDFEWGDNGDDITDKGGGIPWGKYIAGGTSSVKISTDQKYTGTRSVRLYRDGTNNCAPNFSHTCGTDYALRYRARKDDTAQFDVYHGNAGSITGVQWLANEAVYTASGASTGKTASHSAWHLFELRNFVWSPSVACDIYIDDTLVKASAGSLTVSWQNNSFGFYNSAGTSNIYIDNVIIRNWRATEPAWGSWGAQEIARRGPHIYVPNVSWLSKSLLKRREI